MFGIPLATIISFALTYGPKIMALIQALQPVFKAAEPLIAQLVSNGMSHDQATAHVFKGVANMMAANADAAIRAQGNDNG